MRRHLECEGRVHAPTLMKFHERSTLSSSLYLLRSDGYAESFCLLLFASFTPATSRWSSTSSCGRRGLRGEEIEEKYKTGKRSCVSSVRAPLRRSILAREVRAFRDGPQISENRTTSYSSSLLASSSLASRSCSLRCCLFQEREACRSASWRHRVPSRDGAGRGASARQIGGREFGSVMGVLLGGASAHNGTLVSARPRSPGACHFTTLSKTGFS